MGFFGKSQQEKQYDKDMEKYLEKQKKVNRSCNNCHYMAIGDYTSYKKKLKSCTVFDHILKDMKACEDWKLKGEPYIYSCSWD